jgi:predicted alpha/beta-fold hydrolase
MRSRLLEALLALMLAGVPGCNNLFYFPARRAFSIPSEPHRDVLFRTSDDVELHGWLFPSADRTRPRGTFVHFHGNAGNITSHYRALSWVTRQGWALFTFDYRGYGRSGWHPTPEGTIRDAVAALGWSNRNLPQGEHARDLVLYGQSLGGAVLLRALDEVPVRSRFRAVVIEGSFHSYEEIAASVLYRHPILSPLTGLGYALVSDRYAPSASVARVSPIPLLVIHDRYDPVVPAAFGAALYELGRAPKTFWVTHRGGHIRALDDLDVRDALLAWLERPPTQNEKGPPVKAVPLASD